MYKRWRNNLNEVDILFSTFFLLRVIDGFVNSNLLDFFFMQILMPVFPGQLRYIRKNLFHAVYVLDPATSCGLEASFNSDVYD